MANPDFSISEFLAWARTKPAGERYDFCDARNCAVAQYGRETGRHYLIQLGDIGRYSVSLRTAVVNQGNPEGWTFGALVTRLEALLPAISDTWTRADAYLIERVEA